MSKKHPTEFENFDAMARRVIAVPKSKIIALEKKRKRRRSRKK